MGTTGAPGSFVPGRSASSAFAPVVLGVRRLVIARKLSFGPQSEAGARTREVLRSVLNTLRKRTDDVTAVCQRALDRLAEDPTLDLCKRLFRSDSS
jgi:hypothetical protein